MWDFDFFSNSTYLSCLWLDEANWQIPNYSTNYWSDLTLYWPSHVPNTYVEYRRPKKGFFSPVSLCHIKLLDTRSVEKSFYGTQICKWVTHIFSHSIRCRHSWFTLWLFLAPNSPRPDAIIIELSRVIGSTFIADKSNSVLFWLKKTCRIRCHTFLI